LGAAAIVPLVGLVPLALWSRASEPHWIAPALLALPLLHAVRITRRAKHEDAIEEPPYFASRALGAGAVVTAFAMTIAVHAWVLVPDAMRLWPASAPPRGNIARELFGWPDAVAAVRRSLESIPAPLREPAGDDILSRTNALEFAIDTPIVVGPHWTICAQIHAALGPTVPVGCMTPVTDDFDRWMPRDIWTHARSLVVVRDDRFEVDLAHDFPTHVLAGRTRVSVTRGGRILRVFIVDVLEPRALGARDSG
jgi:hypothetical protein